MLLPSRPKGDAGTRTRIAYEALKEAIFANRLEPGAHLSENQLALALGMSRTPVREAIRVLASEGLLDIHNGIGVFVRQVTVKEITELFEVRAALECAAVPSALQHISAQEIDSLAGEWMNLKQQLEAGLTVGLQPVSELDFRLHSLIVERCDNAFLKQLVAGIRGKIMRYQKIVAMALADERALIDQHLEIMRYMKIGEAEILARILKKHIQQSALYLTDQPSWSM